MFIVGMLSWWYTAGWKKIASVYLGKLAVTEDYFSIDILLGSLFSPYKQISASGSGTGTFQDQLRDWGDRQFSRIFGAMIRLLLIVVGIGWLLIQSIFYGACLVLWPLAPIAPLIGVVLMLLVGTPWSN